MVDPRSALSIQVSLSLRVVASRQALYELHRQAGKLSGSLCEPRIDK
jgi:hypothetical protein